MKRFIALVSTILMFCALGACSQNTASETPSFEPTPTIGQTTPPSASPPPSEPTAPSEPTVPSAEPQTLSKPQVLTVSIPAPSLENSMIGESTEQPAAVYLPAGYETSGKNYPVLYFLPGFGDSHSTLMSFISRPMPENAEMIVVVVNGMGKLNGSFYSNSPVTGNWEDYITQDVISYIDENYRTIAESSGRGLAGHSMGGFGVVNIVMHNSGLFDYAYSMSPGLFGENGLSKSAMNMGLIEKRIEEYKDLSDEEAAAEYQSYMSRLSWPTDFSFAYGSTFAYDTVAKAPYIQLPGKGSDGEYLRDEIWARYESGYGNLAEKVITYGDNLRKLKRLTIEYGLQDEYSWIPEGCEYFSELLTEQGITHELDAFTGGHGAIERLGGNMIPFFIQAFSELG